MKRLLSVLTIALVSVGLVACSDDPTGVTGELTEQEAAELAEVIFTQGFDFSTSTFDDASTFSGAPDLQAVAGVPFGPITLGPEDVPCEFGGVVTVEGTIEGDVDQETGAGTMDLSLTQVHDDCGVRSDSGTNFTLNGNPETGMDLGFDMAETGEFTMAGTFGGGIAWLTSDRSGTCSIDLSIDASGNAETEELSGTVTGTVCGRSIDETIP